ncbi:MAG: aromatic ring-hydroxylating dioxygenase subunit alpha [Nocardioides sp.]|uniref:aromatic ring-hydroxylating oxygenase subunit alpha n=1 Tax=Nocardioides sp. TaxID=35761 RepID=UPI0039E44AED
MSIVLEPKLKQRGQTPWFEGDVPPDMVPDKYRLNRAFVPKGRYLDPDFQDLELERVFGKAWLMACRVEELTGVGSYVEYEIGKHSIIIVREAKDSIRAYFNACRHRGTRLARGKGRVGSLICPFHGWRWNLDGSIRLVLDREEFVPRSDDDLGLVRVRVDTWGGFVFINMDPEAIPLHAYLNPIVDYFAPFQFENMRARWWKSTVLPCNWKTALDGFLEAYHVAGTHPQLFRMDKSNTNTISIAELEHRAWAPTTTYERHAHYSALGEKSTVKPDTGKDPNARGTDGIEDPRVGYAMSVQYIYDDMKGLENERSWQAAEALKTAEIPEGSNVGEVFMRLYRETVEASGREYCEISPQQWADAGTAWNVFPNTILLPNNGSAFGYRARPHGSNPDQCLFEIFALDQIPVADYGRKWELEHEHFEDYRDGDFGEVFGQDMLNAWEVTVGMHSPSFDGHRLSEYQEMTIYNHHRVADRFLWG